MHHTKIRLSRKKSSGWRDLLIRDLSTLKNDSVIINSHNWELSIKDLTQIKRLCKRYDTNLISIESRIPETIVSAKSIGLEAKLKTDKQESNNSEPSLLTKKEHDSLLIHQGTLRAGESLSSEGDLMIIGDVNPGAIVSANGNVMIWGRLLGIAHAGKDGNKNKKITALQLRALQLRIADKVARGPKEKPQQGLAEEACIESEVIILRPAQM